MRFKPYPGLTIFTLIATAILLTLGTWQYNRLQWKTQLLADIDAAANSAPFDSYGQIARALEDGEPIDFRRVTLSGRYGSATKTFHVFKIKNKKNGWRLYRRLNVFGGRGVFTAGEFIPDALKDIPRPVSNEVVSITGYVRTYQKPSRFAAKSSPETNRWFSFNALKETHDWGILVGSPSGVPLRTDFYVDIVQTSDAPITNILPIKKPDLPNNHFDYMLTWYSFALILWVIYVMLHIRGGRLKFRH